MDMRLKRRIKVKYCPELKSFCWLYEAATGKKPGRNGGNGYTQICICKADRYKYGGPRFPNVHRVAYIEWIGPIPEGMTIDHLCSRRNCINPEHLEPTTIGDNCKRSPHTTANKTHCPEGHPYSGDNLYEYNGKRFCRVCRARQVWEYDQRNKELRRVKAQERRERNKI